jgi:hypothetical protein
MNRVLTALALSGMLVSAPAFAKTVHKSSSVTKSVAGDKAGETKPAEGTTPDTAKKAKGKKKPKSDDAAPAPTAPKEGAPTK